MYVDAQQLLSDAQALTATAASTNYIDLGVDRDMGPGESWSICLSVDVAADFTTGDETYSFAVQTDDNTSFSSATTLSTVAILASALTAGSKHMLFVGLTNERYIRVNYTLAGTTPTVTVTTFGCPSRMIPARVTYASGYSIT
jgi:hypothetical protein